jgi:hypothetical protein
MHNFLTGMERPLVGQAHPNPGNIDDAVKRYKSGWLIKYMPALDMYAVYRKATPDTQGEFDGLYLSAKEASDAYKRRAES